MKHKNISYADDFIYKQKLLDRLDDTYYEYMHRRFMEVYFDVSNLGASNVWKTICQMVDDDIVTAKEMYETVVGLQSIVIQDVYDEFAKMGHYLDEAKQSKLLKVEQERLERFLLQ